MARRRARSSGPRRGKSRGKKGFPWLLAGIAGIGAFYLYEKSASAAPSAGGGGGAPPVQQGQGGASTITPAPNPPTPTPAGGITPGRYMVSTHDTGPSGNLMMRDAPSTNGAIVEQLPHGSYVQASGIVTNGFAAVMAPDTQTGWSSLLYLTAAP